MAAAEKIRVIIVDDIAETRENIRKLLQFENDVEVVGVARTGREGLDLTKETKPDVVLMDINMPDMDGITATESIRKSVPFSQIIILSVQSDPNYMRRAMLAGARDFLTKPPSVDELTSAIRRAGVMAREERTKTSQGMLQPTVAGQVAVASSVATGKVIAVYSPKGGTGCTTLATNLAVTLNSENTPTVLVDGNMQFGDVAIFLNEQGKNSVVDLAPRADELDPEIVESVLVKHGPSSLKILPAPHRPEEAEGVRGDQVLKVLKYLSRMYTYVVVDASSDLSDVTLSVIDASDIVILITTQEIPTLKNCRLFLDLADALGLEKRRILFVMNRFDKRINILPEKISENFKLEIVGVLPLDERVVVPSVNRGVPFMLGNKSHPMARSMLALADSVKQRLSAMDTYDDSSASAGSKGSGKK
ncbi:MAG: AAA family ATPase [Chloroflexota bacterium]